MIADESAADRIRRLAATGEMPPGRNLFTRSCPDSVPAENPKQRSAQTEMIGPGAPQQVRGLFGHAEGTEGLKGADNEEGPGL